MAIVILLVVCVLSVSIRPADAGGSWMYPVKDRYEPGETVTMVGYFGGGAYGPVADEPYLASLQITDDEGITTGAKLAVGELDVSKVAFQWRASISFDLPWDLEAGQYFLDYCTEGCERRMGDLIGGYVYVGVDPPYAPSRSWPADEPEIENLADDVKLWIHGLETTAAEVRSGVWVRQSTPEPNDDYPPATPAPATPVPATAVPVTPTPATPTSVSLTNPSMIVDESVTLTAAVTQESANIRVSRPISFVALFAAGGTALAVRTRSRARQRGTSQQSR